MAALRDIQNKIAGVKKTRQITKAMNMVAAAKLRQVQGKTEAFRPYAEKFAEVLGSLAQGIDPEIHPLLAQPEQVDRVAVILLTADRGLCGAFNNNLISLAEKTIAEMKAKGQEAPLYAIGRRGVDYFKKRDVDLAQTLPNVMNVIDFDLAVQVARMGLNAFLSGEVQEVYLVFCEFGGMGRLRPKVERLLPISPLEGDEDEEGDAANAEYLCEPSAEEILVDLLPRYINVSVYQALLETATSEHAARMQAMDNATSNCKDLIESLTLAFNKARQAAITTELMDIVGGAEALKQG